MADCRIKFCGLRTEADVEAAVACGVWAVGFVFTESPRRVDLPAAQRLAAAVPDDVTKVGLFTDEPTAMIREAVEACGLDLVQVVNDNPAGGWDAYAGLPLLRAFRVRGPESLAALEAVRGETFLLDAYVPGRKGGTGASFDWSLARTAARYGRVVLAGGLTPGNVGRAIAEAIPWAVDVSSGIESARGVKDPARMRAFAAAVRAADAGAAS